MADAIDSSTAFVDAYDPTDEVYLLSHSIGRMPRTAMTSLARGFFEPWATDTENAWPNWLAAIERFRQALASLFGSEARNFCPQANVSSAVTKIVHALPESDTRRALVIAEEAFPSVGFVLQAATAAGHTVRLIPRSEDVTDPAVWDEYLGDDSAVALITHVHFNSGVRTPVAPIVDRAREAGAVSIVDVAQSAGAVPIDVEDWNADFVVGSCVKWLCGGPGAGYLWANPATVENYEPVDVGWFSHAEPFEFDIHHFAFAPDALRFWGGTPSVAPYVIAANSLELIAATGVDTIRAHNVAESERIIAAVGREALRAPEDPALRGGTLILNFGERHQQRVEALQRAAIRFDARAAGIRLSVHLYNTKEEIDRLLSVLA